MLSSTQLLSCKLRCWPAQLVEHKCSTSIQSTVSAGKAAGRAEGSFRANILLVKMYLQDSFSAVYSVALCGVPHGVRANPRLDAVLLLWATVVKHF